MASSVANSSAVGVDTSSSSMRRAARDDEDEGVAVFLLLDLTADARGADAALDDADHGTEAAADLDADLEALEALAALAAAAAFGVLTAAAELEVAFESAAANGATISFSSSSAYN